MKNIVFKINLTVFTKTKKQKTKNCTNKKAQENITCRYEKKPLQSLSLAIIYKIYLLLFFFSTYNYHLKLKNNI